MLRRSSFPLISKALTGHGERILPIYSTPLSTPPIIFILHMLILLDEG